MTGPKYIEGQQVMFGQPDAIGFGSDDLMVRVWDRQSANEMVRSNHYSKRVYSGSTIHLAIEAGGVPVGVLQYGHAMNPASGASVVRDTKVGQFLELNRMWVDDSMPRNTESRAISYSMKLLRRLAPQVQWVQSFADERCQGRLGVVYQAANFTYCGEHLTTFYELDGEWYHKLMMERDPSQSKRAAHLQRNRDKALAVPLRQFRYVFFLAKSARRRLLLPVLPYPKPAVEVSDGETPDYRSGGVGSTPTHRSITEDDR